MYLTRSLSSRVCNEVNNQGSIDGIHVFYSSSSGVAIRMKSFNCNLMNCEHKMIHLLMYCPFLVQMIKGWTFFFFLLNLLIPAKKTILRKRDIGPLHILLKSSPSSQ